MNGAFSPLGFAPRNSLWLRLDHESTGAADVQVVNPPEGLE